MKIKTIEVNNYKAFSGKHIIPINGKDVFIYGENGSGKSSLYYALKDFFQSSNEVINLNEVENIFIADAQKGNCYVKVTFKPNSAGRNKAEQFELKATSKTTSTGTAIKDANKLKSFLTYKHLLDIHHIKKNNQIDLFDLLVNGVLKHFKYTLSKGKEIGQLWAEVEKSIESETSKRFNVSQKKMVVNNTVKAFNDAFDQLFKVPTAAKPNPEYILNNAQPILDLFKHNIEVKLFYRQAKPNSDYTAIEKNQVHIELTYAGKKISKPHLFLNEARLSAIAISIYLGMIKRHPQLLPYKILFLDDIFIGLDIANRLPLLDILSTHFQEYQIFITTYDKPWFEYAKSFLKGNEGWTTLEFYSTTMIGGNEIPKIIDNGDYIKRAEDYLAESDYKCSAVYTRTAFEKEIQKYCNDKGLLVKYHKQSKKYSSEDFWNAIKRENLIAAATVTEVQKYRELVLNPFSHYNTEKHEIKTELIAAIAIIKTLKAELGV